MTTEQTNINAASTQDPAAQPAQNPTDGANSGQSNGATLTQEEVNKLVGKARVEGKQTAVTDLLKTLGVASADEIKALIEDARKLKQSQLTESEKLQAERDQIKTEKEDAIAQLNAERAERRNDRIESELRSALTVAKANNPKTVLSYVLVNHREAMQALLTDDGKIDDKAMTALIETVKKEDPTLFATVLQGAGSPSNAGGRATGQIANTDAAKRAHQMNQKLIRG